jgi:starch-binding outer membrane protein, SusD/RagB family
MNMRINARDGGGGFPLRRVLGTLAIGALLPVTGCDLDRFVTVTDTDVVEPGFVSDPRQIDLVYAGALSDFSLGYVGMGATGGGQTGEGILMISAMFSDEAYAAGTFGTRQDASRRDIDLGGELGTTLNSNLQFAERWLHRARRNTENAAGAFVNADLENDRRRGEMLGLAGFTYVLFGENYCSGVPFSHNPLTGFAPQYEAGISTRETFERAIARFDAALAVPGLPARERNLARVGKARALLNLNRPVEAAAEAALVDENFNYVLSHSLNSARQENPLWHFGFSQSRYGIPNRLGNNGLAWLEHEAAGDPRVRTTVRPAFDAALGNRPMQDKYGRAGAVPLASYVEARLIVAEAQLRAGNFAGAGGTLEILNALRASETLLRQQSGLATATALPALADPGEAGRVDLLFQERALWLWLTAHRLGDMRRLVRDYGRPVNTVFPVGPHGYYTAANAFVAASGGGSFGTQVSLPLYIDEANNPAFTGGCDPTQI